MNKTLWLITQNKENTNILQSKYIIKMLQNEEINAYGEAQKLDDSLDNQDAFWISVDNNFDFLNFLEKTSKENSFPLIGGFDDKFYCYDSNGKRSDDGRWGIEEVSQFINSNWNFNLIVWSSLFNKKDETLEFTDAKTQNSESNKYETEVKNIVTEEITINNKNEEQPEERLINTSSVNISNDIISNESLVNEINKISEVEENIANTTFINTNSTSETSNIGELCEVCFSINCKCEKEDNKLISENVGMSCSQKSCESCTGCQWDFDSEDDLYYNRNFSKESSPNAHELEVNNDFLSTLDFNKNTFSVAEDSTIIEKENTNIFDINYNDSFNFIEPNKIDEVIENQVNIAIHVEENKTEFNTEIYNQETEHQVEDYASDFVTSEDEYIEFNDELFEEQTTSISNDAHPIFFEDEKIEEAIVDSKLDDIANDIEDIEKEEKEKEMINKIEIEANVMNINKTKTSSRDGRKISENLKRFLEELNKEKKRLKKKKEQIQERNQKARMILSK